MFAAQLGRFARTAAVTAALGGIGLAFAGPALAADPVGQSAAQAANVTLLNNAGTVASPRQAAVNTGGPTVTASDTSALSLVPAQTLLTAGAVAATATAQNDGLSFACSGVVQPGATVTVGANGASCTSTGSGAGGASVDLAQVGGLTLPVGASQLLLQVDAVTAHAANNAGATSGGADVTNARLFVCTGVVIGGACSTSITAPVTITGAVNEDLVPAIGAALTGSAALGPLGATLSAAITPLVTVRANVQYVDPTTNAFTVIGLSTRAVSGTAAAVDLATVSAGPNAVPTPMVSGLGWPIGLAAVAMMGAVVVAVRQGRAGRSRTAGLPVGR